MGLNDRVTIRGQVGIGTLILFAALVLVAIIAGGVVLDVGGFLQSSGEATGEQASKQGTDRLQVLSASGTVTNVASPSNDVIGIKNLAFDIDESEHFDYIDAGSTVTVTLSGGDGAATLTSDTADDLTVENGETLRFEKVDSSTLRITNVDDDESISFDPADDLTVAGSDSPDDTFELAYVFDDPNYGQTTITIGLREGSSDSPHPLSFETRTRSYIELGGTGLTSILVSDGETVTVGSDTDVPLTNSDGDELPVSVGEELTFAIDSDGQGFTVTNEAGTTLAVDAEGRLGADKDANLETYDDVYLETDGKRVRAYYYNAGLENDFLYHKKGSPTSRYVFTRDLPDGETELAVTQLDLLVGNGPGSGDIDIERATITMITDQGQSDLTYDSVAVEGETFNSSSILDQDSSFPTLTTGDRFMLIIDSGALEPDTGVYISISTAGGLETERILIPSSLLREGTIEL